MSDQNVETFEHVEKVLSEWAKEHGLNSAVLTKFCLVARGDGFNEEGENISQIMIMPWGSHEDMIGILRNATLRFEAEIVDAARSD